MWALERVIALGHLNPAWPLARTLTAISIYLFANALRGGFEILETSSTSTHPQLMDRLVALNKRVIQLPNGESDGRFAFAGVARVFEALIPHVQTLSAYQLAPPGEVRRVLLEIIDEIPEKRLGEDILLTWQDTYAIATEAFLRQLADGRTGPLKVEQIAPIERWLKRVPGPVLDTLAAAYEGTLFQEDDPMRPLLQAVVEELVSLLRDPFVREAIRPG